MSPTQNPTWPTSYPPFCPTVAPMCPPPAQAQGGQAQAQAFPTLSCTLPVVCFGAQAQAQPGGQAQAQTVTGMLGCPTAYPQACPPPATGGPAQTQPMLTLPPQCGGVYTNAPMCPPPAAANGGAQAQAITNTIALCQSVITCTGLPVVCASGAGAAQAQAEYPTIRCVTGIPHVCPLDSTGGGQAQAQTVLTAPPYCGGIYTNAPMCPPPASGGQAQAQTPPASAICATNIGCTLPIICFAGQAQPGGQGQAQAQVPHTMIGCVVSAVCGGGHFPPTGHFSAATICPTVHPQHCLPNTINTIHPITASPGCHFTQHCIPGQGGGEQQVAQAPANGGGQAQAQAITGIPVVCGGGQPTGIPVVCGGGGGQPTGIPVVCGGGQLPITGVPVVCGGGGGQPTGIPVVCGMVANAGGQAQAQAQMPVSAPPFCGGIYTQAFICPPVQGGQAPAPTLSAATVCPTVAPMCPPPAGGQPQAQAQAFTNTIALCHTAIACTGIPHVC